jgi:putative membrane protein
MRIEELIGERGAAAVEAAVRAAEVGTSGEIVPVLVERSDDYGELRLGLGALVAFAAGALGAWLVPEHVHWIVPTQIGVFALAAWALGWRPLLGRILPARIGAARAERAAELAFLEAGVAETRERTGILIYVSLLEHRVVVIADRGVNALVPEGTWDGVVALVIAGIRAHRAEEGLVEGIRRCGEILAARLPPRADDADELANRPRGAGA